MAPHVKENTRSATATVTKYLIAANIQIVVTGFSVPLDTLQVF